MKIRRKSQPSPASAAAPAEVEAGPGPYDVSNVPDDIERIDLGALHVAPVEGLELRLQVNEQTQEVGAVMLAAEDGAMELQAFSAPRSGDLWDEVRPQIAADVERRGGKCEEREGAFGTELVCQLPAKMADGSDAVQPSRFIGVKGDRWLLRATMLGRPAVDFEGAQLWEHALSLVAVDRGGQAMPVGKQLPLVLPEQARRA